MNKTLKIASISDIHLGHKKNDTSFIISNLDKAFPDTSETADLDMIVLVGDVFDSLLMLPGAYVPEIDRWINRLLRLCKKHDIVLRVLEGTPSHDWKQSERFAVINEVANIQCDLKYVKELSIEYIDKFDIHVLYIPDEWDGNNPDNTYNQVLNAMKARDIDKVDFAFMHGQFEYQLAEVAKAPKHDSNKYLDIVTKLIFIGHVHTYSTNQRIIAQGSFDRIAHGEEGPKGHVRAVVNPDNSYQITFVENKSARQFISVDCLHDNLEDTIKQVEKIANTLPDDSFIRIICSKQNPVVSNIDHFVRAWPFLHWSKKVKDDEFEQSEKLNNLLFTQSSFVPVSITESNIKKLVCDRLETKGFTKENLKLVDRFIGEISCVHNR